MKNYLLITVVEREILTEFFDTLEEAQKKMREQLVSLAGMDEELVAGHPDYYSYDEDENYLDRAAWSKDSAYVSDGRNHDNYDWRIVSLKGGD